MMMTHRLRPFAPIVLILFCSLGALTANAQTEAETRTAALLFKQYESVVYTRTDFLSNFDPDAQGSNNFANEAVMRFPFLDLLGSMQFLAPAALSDLAKSYSAVLVGAKDFTGPNGIGMGNSRKCYIGILNAGPQPNLEPDFRQAASESIAGRHVWTWSLRLNEGDYTPTKFYAAQIGNSYFVMTNSPEDFQQAASALTATDSSTPAAVNVFGWNSFSTHKYWAYRAFGRSGDTGSPSQMSDVVALALFADLEKSQWFIRVHSSDKTMKTKPKVLRPSELNQLQPQGAGIWQAKLPTTNDGTHNPMFGVFALLGFGLAL